MATLWIVCLTLLCGLNSVSGELTPQFVFDMLSRRMDSILTGRYADVRRAVNDVVADKMLQLERSVDEKFDRIQEDTDEKFTELKAEILDLRNYVETQDKGAIDVKLANMKEYTEQKIMQYAMVTRKFMSSEKVSIRKLLKNSRSEITQSNEEFLSHLFCFNVTLTDSEQRTDDVLENLKDQLVKKYEDLANKPKQQHTSSLSAEIARLEDTTSIVQKDQQALTEKLTSAITNMTSLILNKNSRPVPDNFLLFTDTNRKAIYRMDIASHEYVSIRITVTDSDNPISIDYDPVDGRIYWTDVGLKQIRSINMDGTGERVTRQLNPNAIPDGIAVDPASRLIYYTDTGNNVIVVLKIDTSFEKVIINAGLDQPRAIVLDPTNSKIYWTDWGNTPKIETANYDGSNRKVIINTDLGWMNGLTLDSAGGKIYWADARKNMIEGANIDGSGRHTILHDRTRHYFGLALYETTLYYTVWNRLLRPASVFGNSTISVTPSLVMSVPVTGGTSTRVGPPDFGRLNDIHVHQDRLYPKGNACSGGNGGCSHFCLPMNGKDNFKCACPTGYALRSDRTCI